MLKNTCQSQNASHLAEPVAYWHFRPENDERAHCQKTEQRQADDGNYTFNFDVVDRIDGKATGKCYRAER